jgi:serine/threonine-protein kinase RsbW
MGSITVPGTLDSLAAIRNYIMEAAEAAGIDKKAAYRLCLAVDEIATNSIVYGYEQTGIQGSLDVQVVVDDKTFKIVLEDTGPAFDPRMRPPPDDLEVPIDKRSTGGLGIYLAVEGVDEFAYERSADRNRNIFIVNHPPKN